MTKQQAIKLAIELIDKEYQRLAVPAHLYEDYGLDWPSAVGASKRRTKLKEAKTILLEE